jgi:hypothetical protein
MAAAQLSLSSLFGHHTKEQQTKQDLENNVTAREDQLHNSIPFISVDICSLDI